MIAQEIMHISRNANDAAKRAYEQCTEMDQLWEDEATIYLFEDDSLLAICGRQVNAYNNFENARFDYPSAEGW
jgi:hypothetical protein